MNEEEKEAIKHFKNYENKLVYEINEKDKKYAKTLLNLIEKLQKELEEKTTILMAGADKVKQLEKENEKLKEKLHEKNERIIELNKIIGRSGE